jgi:phospholipase/carboxylesterase
MKNWVLLLILLLTASAIQSQPPTGEHRSYAERAEVALVSGDYENAVALYRLWLEADPDDFRGWYNYSCALSLADDTTTALVALETAVDLGWRDSTWTMRDPDLEQLHGNPSFELILTRMGQLWRDNQAQTATSSTRYARQDRYAPYLLDLPSSYVHEPSRSFPLVLLLHGRGSSMDEVTDLRERFALPNVIIAQPQAPFAVQESRGGYEYWPSSMQNEFGDTLLHGIRRDAGQWVSDVINDVTSEVRVDTDHVYLIGFSQGAAVACITAIEHVKTVSGIVMVGGYLPETYQDSTAFEKLSEANIEVMIAHGHRDEIVEPSSAKQLQASMENAGVGVTIKLYPAGHEFTDEMIVDVAEWLGIQLLHVRVVSEQSIH